MANSELRAKIRNIIDAPSEEAMHAALDVIGPDLLTAETDAELAAWIDETPGMPESDRLAGLRQDLRPIREAMAEGDDAMLFGTFMAVRNVDDMEELAGLMTPDVIDDMLQVAEQKLAGADGNLAEAIEERLEVLREIREELEMDTDPAMVALQDFLLAASDDDARELLTSESDLLLTDEIGEILSSADVQDDPEAQARVDARRALWRQVRREQARPAVRRSLPRLYELKRPRPS
jgi:hypothetical protein